MPTTSWDDAPLVDLIAHLVSTHHAYLHAELPRLAGEVARLQSLGVGPEALDTVAHLLRALTSDLDIHLEKEEQVLFPCIARLESDPQPTSYPFGSFRVPIEVMESDHDTVERLLQQLRTATNGYVPTGGVHVGWDALLSDLQRLDDDLQVHIALENEVLHPRTIDLERDRERG